MKLFDRNNDVVVDLAKEATSSAQPNGGLTGKFTTIVMESPQNKDITLLTVFGDMDTSTGPEFEVSFLSVLRDKKYKMIVDLKNVNYISSAGWGIFVSELKRIRNEKGDLVLAGMTPDVMDVFKLLQFDSILKYFPDVDSAAAKGFIASAPSKKQTRS